MAAEPVPEPSGWGKWRSFVLLLLSAVVTVVVADLALRRVSPPKYVREVVDAMRDYEHEDPTVLVLGSSHARTFDVMDKIVRERTQGKERILAVPLEWGKFRAYEWLLHNRIVPVLDEKTASGEKKRPSLKKFIMLSAWWDICWVDGDPPNFNLPSRAWQLSHFTESVLEDGLTDHSRNYVTSRWLELWHGSILVSDRGHGHLQTALRERVRPLSPEAKERQFAMKLESWQGIMHRGKICVGHPEELAAADRILAWAQDRGFDVTLMLYPMMPITVTEDDRENVQKPFERMMKELAEKRGVRFVDATFDHNVTDSDFQPDFDHLTAQGHVKFSEWLLADKLAFILDPEPLTQEARP